MIPEFLRNFLFRRMARTVDVNREYLSLRYIRGEGIEIGSRGYPLEVRSDVRVCHVDCHSAKVLRSQCQDADEAARIHVDVIDDARTLEKFQGASQDFVIANHVLEHLQDPLGALLRFFEIVRDGGVVFLALPEKRKTFDANRPTTTLEHLIADQADGGAASFDRHHEEAIRMTPGIDPGQIKEKTAASKEEQGTIHYHCWTLWEMLEMLSHLRRTEVTFDLLHYVLHARECLFVMRKLPPETGESVS
jgi:predicted SAM-dependent methyltransferase